MRSALVLAMALRLRSALAVGTYSRLEAGSKCNDYRIPEVPSKDACFGAAALSIGLTGTVKMQLDGIGFNGCAYNVVANVLIYSVTPAATPATHLALPTLQYICNGAPTTTTTATTTATTATSTTTTGLFAKLGPSSRCSDEGVPEVLSKEACFGAALHTVGLGGTATMELNNIGFSGCVYNAAADMLIYGITPGVTSPSNMKLDTFEYLCSGIPTTTTTTTSTATTTTVVYTRLPPGRRCADRSLPAVPSREACFGAAASAAGLAGRFHVEVNWIGFTGCVYNGVAGILMYGVTPGVTPATTMALPHFEYLCGGEASPLYP